MVTDLFPPFVGGVPTHQWEVATRLARRGHAVEVITARLPSTAARETTDGIRIERVGSGRRLARYAFAWTSRRAIRQAVRDADVVQASSFVAAFPTAAVARAARVPSILTVHEVFLAEWGSFFTGSPVKAWLHRLAERRMMRLRFTRRVCVSDFTRRRLHPPRVSDVVVLNGVNEVWSIGRGRARDPKAPRDGLSRFQFLFYGRAGRSKGLDTLLAAFRLAAAADGNIALKLVLSPGDLEQVVRDQVRSDEVLSRCVEIQGPLALPELVASVASADCVVVPSRSEGFGLCVAEAAALGVPVVATCVGPVPEVISGYHRLVPPDDAQQLCSALQDARAGRWDFLPPRTFDWERTTDAYETLFRSVAR